LQAKRLLSVALGALFMSVPGLACGSGGSSSITVQAYDFGFRAPKISVTGGTTVIWTNTGKTAHTVKGPGFFSQAIDPGQSYSFHFTKPGAYKYLCTLHPTLMRGTVLVK
jgi:plastocyanin